MSLLNKIKNVFGFGYIEEDEFLEETDSTMQAVASIKEPPAQPNVKSHDNQLSADQQRVYQIFDKVVEVTNASLPQYLANAVNPEQQKKYLYDALDASIKQYLADLEVQAQNKCLQLWQTERDELKTEMDNLKQRAKDLEAKRTEMNEQKLSAERQKRALNERVHDLENTILKLEAEKEQLEIENRSMLNKAKVANVYESDIEAMRQQINELKQRGGDNTLAEENAELKAKIQVLEGQISHLSEACEASKVKDEMSGAMFNDLQKRASESIQSAKELAKKIEELEAEIKHKDAQIDDLKKDIAEKDARIEEEEETLNGIQEIVQQIELFEGVKNKLEERIRSLKTELKDAKDENETLKTTIKNNIYAHAQEQKAMRDQIESLVAIVQKNK